MRSHSCSWMRSASTWCNPFGSCPCSRAEQYHHVDRHISIRSVVLNSDLTRGHCRSYSNCFKLPTPFSADRSHNILHVLHTPTPSASTVSLSRKKKPLQSANICWWTRDQRSLLNVNLDLKPTLCTLGSISHPSSSRPHLRPFCGRACRRPANGYCKSNDSVHQHRPV